MSSNRKPNIEGYQKQNNPNNEDYVAAITEGEVQYGLCEIEGIRYPYQEDAMVTSSDIGVKPISMLTDEAVISSYQSSFQEIQQTMGNIDLMGTTCCSATAWIDPESNTLTAWTANLGDSAAYLIIMDETGKVNTRQLTTLHDPDTPEELERLESFKTTTSERGEQVEISVAEKIRRYKNKTGSDIVRLPGGLKLSRGFGDINFEKVGFSHDPEIKKYQIKLAKGETAYIVAGCDGLTETALKPEDLGVLLQKNKDKTVDQMAEALVNAAYNKGTKGSTDNISCGIFKVGLHPASLTVLDGHGAEYHGTNRAYAGYTAGQLAKDISHHFYPSLQKHFEVNLLNLIKDLTMKVPVEKLSSKIKELFPVQEPRDDFKRRLYKYQVEHAQEIYDAQWEMAGQSKDAEAKIAFHFLKNIQETILTTEWKVRGLKATRVEDPEGNYLNTVPPHMVQMLIIIEKAYQTDSQGVTDNWIEALKEVEKMGFKAAQKKSFSLFGIGKRDEKTQEFYQRFVTGFGNRGEKEKLKSVNKKFN